MDFNSLHFVGRRRESALWSDYLADPAGQAILIIGGEGSGKSAMFDQIIIQAWHETEFRCGYVRYDVSADDSPESILRYMMDDAFHAARASAGAVDNPGLRFWQWDAFFDGVGIYRRRMDDIHQLVNQLRFDPQKHIGEQFLGRLQKMSSLMQPESRAIFLIDYSGPIRDEFVEQWKRIVKNLPLGMKFVFTQELNDAFLRDSEFLALPQVKTIPSPPADGLGPLAQGDFDDLLSHFQFRPEQGDVKSLYTRYRGNPYLIRATFDLLQENSSLTVDSFPTEPNQNQLAEKQWEHLVQLGPDVIRLFRAYAFLDVTVSDEVVMQVAGINLKTFKRTLDIPYVRNLIRSSADGHQIADRPLLRLIANDPRTESPFLSPNDYHRRAIGAFEMILQRSIKPDAFAASRIPEHALAIGGPYAFARSVSEVADHFLSLCHFDTALRLIGRAMDKIDPCGKEVGQLQYKIGLIWLKRGDKEKAKQLFGEAVDILNTADDLDVLPDIYLSQAQLAMEESSWNDANHFLTEARKGFSVNEDPQGIVDASILHGKVLWKLNRKAEGEKVLTDALETCKQIEYNRQLLRSQASVYCMLGKLFEEIDEHEKATQYFNKALDLTQDIYDRESEAIIYTNLRVLLEATGGLKRAVEYEEKALAIHAELQDFEAMAVDHTNLAYLAEKMGMPEKAKDQLQKARELYVQYGNEEKVGDIDKAMTLSDSSGVYVQPK